MSTYNFGHPFCKKEYPPASDIQPRCFEDLEDEENIKFVYGRKCKINLILINEAIGDVEVNLRKEIDEYEYILKHGDVVINKYSLEMGYTAQSSALPLLYNSIGYYRGELDFLYRWRRKISPFETLLNVKSARQMELF